MTTSTSSGSGTSGCWALLLALLLFSCSPSGLVLVVQVENVAEGAASIRILTVNNGIASHEKPSLDVPLRPSFTFGINLPDADPGIVSVTVGAFTSEGCLLQTGAGSIEAATAKQSLSLRVTLDEPGPPGTPCTPDSPVLFSATPGKIYTTGYMSPDPSCTARQRPPLRLLGWDFPPDAKVLIGGQLQTDIKVVSAREIEITAPVLNIEPGAVPIRIELRDRPALERTDLLSVELAPPCFLESLARTSAGGTQLDSAVIDFNNDKRPDVAILDTTGTVWFYENPSDLATGMQGLRATSKSFKLSKFAVSATTRARLLPGDLDGDGVPDLALVASSGTALVLNQKSANGTYGETWSSTVEDPGLGARESLLLDLDGDGSLDLLRADTQLWLHHSFASRSYENPTAIAGSVDALAAADFDRDGAIDIATLNATGEVQVLYQQDGAFTEGAKYPARVGCPAVQPMLSVADLDGDGAPDLTTLGTAALLLSRGREFSFGYVRDSAACLGGLAVLAFDSNRDGSTDLAWITGSSGLTLLLASLPGRMTAKNLRYVSGRATLQRLTLADFNQDGRQDLLLGTTVLLNDAP